MKTSDRTLHQLMDRLLAKAEREGDPTLADALAHCVLNVAGDTAGCPLSRLFLLDYAASERGDPDHLKRTIGDRLHTLLMGEAIWGKNTRYLDMLLSCEHFANKDAACSLHQILKVTQPFSPIDM
jgi:hypothetical protein